MTAAAQSGAGTQFKVDHQLCYTAVGKFHVPTAVPVRLIDRFSPKGFLPKINPNLALHCNPVTKIIHTVTGAQQVFKPTNPRAHLACLPITPDKTQPTPKLVVTNQFGRATLDLGQPDLLCLPSWKSMTGPPNLRPTTPPGLSHFTCYPVKGFTGGSYRIPPEVLLKDQFSANPVQVQVNPVPQELCLPTKKIVGSHIYPIVDPLMHLCFGGPKTPIKPKVWDENQFRTSVVSITATKWLCVPSKSPPNPSGVYWVNFDDGKVRKVPLAGGGVSTIASVGPTATAYLAVDGKYVYWGDYGEGTVNKVPLGGGSPTTLASGPIGPESVAVDGTYVYWGNIVDGTVNKVRLGGGGGTTLASGQDNPRSVAVDGTYVYWANDVAGTVMRVRKDGTDSGVATTLANSNGPESVAVDGTYVYWTDVLDGTVNEVPLGGGSATTLASGQVDPFALAMDDTYVYWVNHDGGTVMRIRKDGTDFGVATTLASGQDYPFSVAVYGAYVYWVNRTTTQPSTEGTVMRVPRVGGIATTLASGQDDPSDVAVVP